MGINHIIASYMKNKLNLDSENEEVIIFSLELLFFLIINISSVVLAAWLTGLLKESLVVFATLFVFKSFIGGAHCSSALRCTVLSILLIPSFGAFSRFIGRHAGTDFLLFLSAVCIIFSLILVFLLAPVDSPAKPITSSRHRRNLRLLSFAFLAFVAVLQAVLISYKAATASFAIAAINISIFWQALMLTKQGHAFVNCFESFFSVLKLP